MDREAGLPPLLPDNYAVRNTPFLGKGVVRAVYPDLWRIDIEAEDGGMIHMAFVLGPHFPPIHKDLEQPSHVIFGFVNGNIPDVCCWPLTYRRLLDPERTLTEKQGKNPHTQKERGDTADSEGKDKEPPQHFYHTHLHAERAGDITITVTADHTWVVKTEAGDLIRLNQKRREIDLLAPTVRILSMEQSRIEGVRGEHVHIVMPEILLGTATSDQKLILGNIFMDSRFNPNVQVYDNHVHTGVTSGDETTGPPTMKQTKMDSAQLSDIAKTQKSYPNED